MVTPEVLLYVVVFPFQKFCNVLQKVIMTQSLRVFSLFAFLISWE